MASFKGAYCDFTGINKETKKLGWFYELIGKSFNSKYVYLDSSTYYGEEIRIDRNNGEVFYTDRVIGIDICKSKKLNPRKNCTYKYAFTLNGENLSTLNNVLNELKRK